MGVPPPEPPPETPFELPHPTARTKSSANAVTGIRTRRLRKAISRQIKIASEADVSGHRTKRIRPVGRDGGMPEVREVVVMTRAAVAFAPTVTAGEGHAAPLGNPEHVRVYESNPISVIV